MATNYAGKGRLTGTKAPALPFAPVQYDRQYQDSLNNILRQYFANNDNLNNSLLGVDGGHYLTFPHIAAQDSSSQYAGGNNTPTKVLWNTLDAGLGFTLNNDSTASPTYSGTYKIDYSLQFVNTVNNVVHDVYVWLRINNVDVAGSASKFSVPGKHSGADGATVAYSSITFKINEGDKVALWWATDLAYVASPLTDGIYMLGAPAQTVPFALPSTPSAIGTIAFISGVIP